MSSDFNPLTFEPTEINLTNNPLARVLSQVRFPTILSIEKQDFIASFQEAIRGHYPLLKRENFRGMIMGPRGPLTIQNQPIWRFKSADGKSVVSLAPDFITLETASYSTRTDFLSKFKNILEAVEKHISPTIAERVGIRYVNQIILENRQEIVGLIRPDIAGLIGSQLTNDLDHTICETSFKLGESQLLMKWGLLPGNSVFDTSVLDPNAKLSWFLDFDMFSSQNQEFVLSNISNQLEQYAARIHSFFRWVMEDKFIAQRGGKI